jgi:pimeloyl-ACP methyl ester carboxylesterase
MLPPFHDQGWTSLVIGYRNDPGLPLDPSGRHRFGLAEWEDLEAAVRHARDFGAKKISLMGCSTGGALVMHFLERSELRDLVTGVVLDSPNLVLADTFRHAIDVRPATPLMFEFGLWLADWRWKIDWDATNLVDRSADILAVPALVFHGTSDRTVPISESRRLATILPKFVELVETPAAGHVMSWNADPDRYERYLRGFLGGL